MRLKDKQRLGQYAAGGVVITKGLHKGDYVIIEGFLKLYNGARTSY